MKFVFQLCIILLVSFIGEILRKVIPLPIPASIYGLLIMLLCLATGIVKLDHVKKAGKFLIEIMPVLFIPPAVGLIPAWPQLSGMLVPVIVVILATTVIVMAVSGRVTQALMKKNGGKEQ